MENLKNLIDKLGHELDPYDYDETETETPETEEELKSLYNVMDNIKNEYADDKEIQNLATAIQAAIAELLK